MQKAFDTVDFKILLDKLKSYGFRGLSNKWIRSYLTGRKQFVHIGGKNSLIYINDLPNSLRFCFPYFFADDTVLLYIERYPKALQKKINIDMKLLPKWLKANKISLNVAKTEIIIFKHHLNSMFDF